MRSGTLALGEPHLEHRIRGDDGRDPLLTGGGWLERLLFHRNALERLLVDLVLEPA